MNLNPRRVVAKREFIQNQRAGILPHKRLTVNTDWFGIQDEFTCQQPIENEEVLAHFYDRD